MLPIQARDRATPVAPDAAVGVGLPIQARGYPDEQPLSKKGAGLPIPARGYPDDQPLSKKACTGLPIPARGEPAPSATTGPGLPIQARGEPAPAAGGLGLPIQARGELDFEKTVDLDLTAAQTFGCQSMPPRLQTRRRSDPADQEHSPLEAPAEHEAVAFRRSRTMLIGGRSRARRLRSTSTRKSLGEDVLKGAHFSAIIRTHGEEVPIAQRYTFGRMLGEGATGSTWEAWPTDQQGCASPTQKGHRAIKKLTKYGASKQEREVFRQEVELLKELDHPNICKLYEVFEDATALYMVMDMCEGGELFDRIVDEELHGEAQAADLLRQIAGALRYCHETHGIMHRDIKPENVLFTTSDNEAPVKVIDFGIACFTKDALQNRQAGTEAYEAPEVLLKQDYDEKCDLWSLGALLFVILSGCMPFQSVEHAKRGDIHFEEEHWREVSPSARDLTTRLLAVDPARRPSAAEVLDHPWVASASPSLARRDQSLAPSVFARLKSFKQTTALRKILLMVLSRQLTDVDLPETYQAFQQIDTDGDGKLSHSEIRDALGSRMSAEEVDQAIQAMDADGSGNVEYSEFLAAAFDRKLLFRQDLCLQVFRALDKEATGVISIEGLMQMMDGVVDCPHRGAVCARLQMEAKELLECFDANGDGVLDFAEFTNLLTRNSFSDSACPADLDGLADLAHTRRVSRRRTSSGSPPSTTSRGGSGLGEPPRRASRASTTSRVSSGPDEPPRRASTVSRASRASSAGEDSSCVAVDVDGPTGPGSVPGKDSGGSGLGDDSDCVADLAGSGTIAPEAGRASTASRASRRSSGGEESGVADNGPTGSGSCPGEDRHGASAPLRASRWMRARLSTSWMRLRASTSQEVDEGQDAQARQSMGAPFVSRPSVTGEARFLSCIAGLCQPERRSPSAVRGRPIRTP